MSNYEFKFAENLKQDIYKLDPVDCIVTSVPPIEYEDAQEQTNYICSIMEDARYVLTDSGNMWIKIRDFCVDGALVGFPWRTALQLRNSGWYFRAEPLITRKEIEQFDDRPDYVLDYIFQFTKTLKNWYDYEAVMEEVVPPKVTKNYWKKKERGEIQLKKLKRELWGVSYNDGKGTGWAYDEDNWIRNCVLLGCPEGKIVLDPFCTNADGANEVVQAGRNYIGFCYNAEDVSKFNSNVDDSKKKKVEIKPKTEIIEIDEAVGFNFDEN